MVVLFVTNLILIMGVIYSMRPKSVASFSIQQVSIQQPDSTKPEFLSATPNRIIIPEKSVSVPVEDGVYDSISKKWTLGSKTAHHALITPNPNNQSGNTFIYGHNKRDVFGPIVDLNPGAEALIETDEGITFRYVLRSVKDVDPSDISLFEYEGPAILTVQTCSGAWYEQRRLFTFELMETIR